MGDSRSLIRLRVRNSNIATVNNLRVTGEQTKGTAEDLKKP